VVYLGPQDDNVYGLDAKTGAVLLNYSIGNGDVGTSVAVANGVVYMGLYFEGVWAFHLPN